jgi:hypothetical protein
MADKQFGGAVPVDLNPIFRHVAGKVASDSEALKAALENHGGLHDFEEQSRLLSEIQAGVRATDIMAGDVTSGGTTIPPKAADPAGRPKVDLDGIEAEISKAA